LKKGRQKTLQGSQKTLASGSADSTLTLWDVATRQPIGQSLTGHSEAVFALAFSPDKKMLVSASLDHTIILWDLELQSLIEKTCQRAGCNYSRSEWAQYFLGEAYPTQQKDAICPQWPLEPITIPSAIL
jgi:WD40 repeat protein